MPEKNTLNVKILEALIWIFPLTLVKVPGLCENKKSDNDPTLKVQGTNNQSVKKGPFIL